ncbi:MAG: HAMP domain-containing sensor histidine kinase [Candidatus Limnocylindrales bacterium]
MTIRMRLAVAYVLAIIATVTLVGVTVWWQMGGALREAVQQSLQERAAAVLSGFENDGSGGLQEGDFGTPGVFVTVLDRAGAIIDASPGAPAGLPVPLTTGASDASVDGRRFLLFTVRGGDVTVITGTGSEALGLTLDRLAWSLLMVGGAAALASMLGGWILAGRALRPVVALAGEAERIDTIDLDRRLHVPAERDEVQALAVTLNRMLARVASAVRQQRAFLAAASHDLRTPIAALQAELDLARHPATTDLELRRAVEAAHGDAVRLGDLATALLDLAALDGEGRALVRTPVRIDEFMASVARHVEPLARQRGVRIATEAPGRIVRVDRVRLGQAITNLVINAIAYGPAGGTVDVVARVTPVDGSGGPTTSAMLRIEVMDRGVGLPAEVVSSDLFQPFRRGPNAVGVGSGLGLATAAAAITAHHGSIGYEKRPGGGATFWVVVPA